MAKIRKILFAFAVFTAFICNAGALDAQSITHLVPMGHTTGIKLYCDGVMVVDIARVETSSGEMSPAQSAGIAPGDVIEKLNGEHVHSNEQFKKQIEKSKGKAVSVELVRNGEKIRSELKPVKDSAGEYKAGIWIRDSVAGIGTFTFYDPQSKTFGALGHGICDSETNALVPFGSGSIMRSKVSQVKRGSAGQPGELIGEYDMEKDTGKLSDNTHSGIFGKLEDEKILSDLKVMPIGKTDQVHTGAATVLSNVNGDKVESFAVDITRIFPQKDGETKNMMLHVTDKRLIEKTGGIVQGMSGSPIIQDGKFIGAVTHVLVNDPTRGYGIFIENMLAAAG